MAGKQSEDRFPYGRPGDLLWVRESWRRYDRLMECTCYAECRCPPDGTVLYRADVCDESRWKPSIYLPRTASRITLRIKEVRLESVQAISETDAIAEGIQSIGSGYGIPGIVREDDPRAAYRVLWDRINVKRRSDWASNPAVQVLCFAVIRSNVDAVVAADQIKPRTRAILFSTPMVQALLEGRKMQTRRVVKTQTHALRTGVAAEQERNP